MEMTKKEIIKSYREAADRLNQITILAQLNDVPREKIVRILVGEGVDLSDLPTMRGRWPVSVPGATEELPAKEEKREIAKAYDEKRRAIKDFLRDNHLRASWVWQAVNGATGAAYSVSRVSHALSLEHGRNLPSDLAIVDVACAVCGLDKAKAEAER